MLQLNYESRFSILCFFAFGEKTGSRRRKLNPTIPTSLLIKIYRKRGIGWLIALDEPIFNRPKKIDKKKHSFFIVTTLFNLETQEKKHRDT